MVFYMRGLAFDSGLVESAGVFSDAFAGLVNVFGEAWDPRRADGWEGALWYGLLMNCNTGPCHFKALWGRRMMIRVDQSLGEYHGDDCF